jgi:hypothetical protein
MQNKDCHQRCKKLLSVFTSEELAGMYLLVIQREEELLKENAILKSLQSRRPREKTRVQILNDLKELKSEVKIVASMSHSTKKEIQTMARNSSESLVSDRFADFEVYNLKIRAMNCHLSELAKTLKSINRQILDSKSRLHRLDRSIKEQDLTNLKIS